MRTSHLFLFTPGVWQGQGTIHISGSVESLPFYARWNIAKQNDLQQIEAVQQVKVQGSDQKLLNTLVLSQLTAKSFSIQLNNQYVKDLVGKGVIDAQTIAWEFHNNDQGMQGLEVYNLQPDGSYQCTAEFTAGSFFRTKISYYLQQVKNSL